MNRTLASGKKINCSAMYREKAMTKDELQNLILLAISQGDIKKSKMYKEQLKGRCAGSLAKAHTTKKAEVRPASCSAERQRQE